ncbi:MAG: hypothetical protein SGILL_000367 [Bacillariaceae sp.]
MTAEDSSSSLPSSPPGSPPSPSQENREEDHGASSTGNSNSNSRNTRKRHHNGSGLALFFSDILPISNVGYATSLAQIENDSENKERFVNVVVPSMTYREHRDAVKIMLMDFLGRRISEAQEEESSSESDDDDGDDRDLQEEEEDMTETQPQTQPLMQTQDFRMDDDDEDEKEQEDFPDEQRPRKRRRKKAPKQNVVPHIKETVHEVSKLEYLNLYTQTLHLPLCRVIKVWNIRDTKRGALAKLEGIVKPCPTIEHGHLSRIPFGDMEEDGPAAAAFRWVVSMELEQLKVVDHPTTAMGSSSFTSSRQRIKVFFYNCYAEKISTWMKEQREKHRHEFILNLSNIPAKCIFPRAIDPHNWMEQNDMVEYCLCIGSASNAKLVEGGTYIQFHDEKLQVTITARSVLEGLETDKNNAHSDDALVLSQESCGGGDLLSSSEETKEMDSMENPVEALKNTWSKYAGQFQNDADIPVANGDDNDDNDQPDRNHQNQQQNCSRQQPQSPACDPQVPVENQQDQESDSSPATPTRASAISRGLSQLPFVNRMKVIGNATRLTDGGEVEYTKLSDIEDIYKNSKQGRTKKVFVNIYAVVLQLHVPKRTRRGARGFPMLARMGDVLRIHRAELEMHEGKVKIQGNKFKSSYVVVRKTEQEEWTLFPTARNTFHFHPVEEILAHSLWEFGQRNIKESANTNADRSATLGEISAMKNSDETRLKDRDMTVMVAGVFPFPQMPSGVNPHGFLRIWDGTGIPPSDPFCVQTFLTQQAAGRGEPPPEALAKVVDAVNSMEDKSTAGLNTPLRALLSNHPGMETPLSFCGRVANAVIWEPEHWALIQRYASVDPTKKSLKEFVDEENLGVFTGSVLVKFVPELIDRDQLQEKLQSSSSQASILFRVEDESKSVTALASEAVREKLRRIVDDINTWNELVRPNRTFTAKLRSVNWSDRRYFVLKELV